jgi:hypothetical protein
MVRDLRLARQIGSLRYPEQLVAAGRIAARARVSSWLATLRQCLDADTWPGPAGWEIEPPPWEQPLEGEADLSAGTP